MSDNETDTPLTDGVIKKALQFNPHPLCFGPLEELRDGWQYMASRIEQHARSLERQLAEAKEELDGLDQALANAEHWMSECEKLERQLAEAKKDADALRAEIAIAKADTERLDWLEEGGWEVYPSGRKYCIAHDIYDAVYAPDLRQAIDKAREEATNE